MQSKFRESFNKDLQNINQQSVFDDVLRVIENVESALKPQEILNLKKMKGSKTAFRIRLGKYRIGIYIIADIVEFTRILPRDKIYKYFPK